MAYVSTTYITSNENGEEEVHIEYSKTLIHYIFGQPNTKEVYIGGGTVWYSKGKGYKANAKKVAEICSIVECHRKLINENNEK